MKAYDKNNIRVSVGERDEADQPQKVYLRVGTLANLAFTRVDSTEARAIAAALVQAADEFDALVAEANDPLAKTVKLLNAAGNYAIVSAIRPGYVVFRKDDGEWSRIAKTTVNEETVREVAKFIERGDFSLTYEGVKA